MFQEERRFLLDTFRWSDRRIAERWGIAWDTYTQYFRRHPELGPIVDPEAAAEARHNSLVGAIALGRKRSEAKPKEQQ